MEITYIGHSGFLIEWESCYWLFDYYIGELPDLNTEKDIFVFVSHKHGDHYNPEIFKLYQKYPNIRYILSSDIRLTNWKLTGMGITEDLSCMIISVKPSSEYELYDSLNQSIHMKTLKSTDCGVAFLLQYQGRTIYHAGDLNLWYWKGETKQYNNNMISRFHREMLHLQDLQIDIAFVPFDPKLEECYSMGPESLLSTAKVKYVFPMHFWDRPSVISQFKHNEGLKFRDTIIMDVSQKNQKWTLDI